MKKWKNKMNWGILVFWLSIAGAVFCIGAGRMEHEKTGSAVMARGDLGSLQEERQGIQETEKNRNQSDGNGREEWEHRGYGSEIKIERETESESGEETNRETESESDIETEAGTEYESSTETEQDNESESAIESETEIEMESIKTEESEDAEEDSEEERTEEEKTEEEILAEGNKKDSQGTGDNSETENIEYKETETSGETEYTETEGMEESEYTETEKSGETEYTETEGMGESEYTKTEISGETEYTETEEMGESEYTKTEISGETGYTETEEIRESEYTETEESGETGYTETEEIRESEYTETEESGETGYTETEGMGESEYTETEESGETGYTETEGMGESEYTETEESGETEKKESLPQIIKRGRHYDIRGDQNAWYRDGNDCLWVRKGTNLYIETRQESEYNSRGLGKGDAQEDGILTFQLKQTDEKGNVLQASQMCQESYYVDGEAPSALIQVSGNSDSQIVYAPQSASGEIRIEPDGKSGLKKAAYCIAKCQRNGALLDGTSEEVWQSCQSGQQIRMQEEGLFKVFVRTEDQVGNVGFSQSSIICVDQTPPELVVEGVEDQTANSGSVNIKVTCSDQYYQKGSMKVQITGANGGKAPLQKSSEEKDGGAAVEFMDFPKSKSYDDVYELYVTALDLAGNQTEKRVKFSINRFGSVYELSDDTKEHLQQYYLDEAQRVVFYETNIDYVGESEIYCRKNGELVLLERGKDYEVIMEGSRDSWKQYQYVISETYFQEEGVYEMLLASSDKANNQSDTGIQEKKVTFVLDHSAPTCTITGVEAEQVYQGDSVTAYLVPQDNFDIETMQIYQNNKLIQERTVKSQEMVKLAFEASEEWQTFQVYLRDYSGNEYWSGEIPFYVGQEKEVLAYEQTKAVQAESIAAPKVQRTYRTEGICILAIGMAAFFATIIHLLRVTKHCKK